MTGIYVAFRRTAPVCIGDPNVDIAVARQVTAEVLADIQTLGAQL